MRHRAAELLHAAVDLQLPAQQEVACKEVSSCVLLRQGWCGWNGVLCWHVSRGWTVLLTKALIM